MDDIRFSCLNCKQHFVIEAVYAGTEINCPNCGSVQSVPTLVSLCVNPSKETAAGMAPPSVPQSFPCAETDAEPYRYWAFISYSSKDKAWGSWLHGAIENYGVPSEFVTHHKTPTGYPAPKRFHPVFRKRQRDRYLEKKSVADRI